MKRSLALLLLITSFAHASSLVCISNFSDDFLYGEISLEAELTALEQNSFELSTIKLDYKLSMDETFDDIWGEGHAYKPNYTIKNKLNYNPRVYTNHVKFEDLYSREIFGFLDLILPNKSLSQKDEVFTGFMIMTAMEDHWGSTVQLECRLK